MQESLAFEDWVMNGVLPEQYISYPSHDDIEEDDYEPFQGEWWECEE